MSQQHITPSVRFTFNQSSLDEAAIKALAARELPESWQEVNSSKNTYVAFSRREPHLFYKEFYARNKLEKIKNFLRGSRCDRACKMATTLTEHGFETPTVIAAGRINHDKQFMLSEAFDGQSLGTYLASIRHEKSYEFLQQKRRIIKALGLEIGRFHQAGFIHGDLRPNNILVKLSGDTPVFSFIDNERTSHSSKQRRALVIKNLKQIGMLFPVDISNTDRLRFLKAYLQSYSRFGDLRQSLPMAQEIYSHTINRLESTPHYQPEQPPAKD